MVMALKELLIRGDFRTTVEYLIRLLETDSFQQNTINTGWLDMLISQKVIYLLFLNKSFLILSFYFFFYFFFYLFFFPFFHSIMMIQLTAERPDTMVAVVCGAVYKADQIHHQRLADFKNTVQKGQPPGPEQLKTDVSIDIIYENVKYNFTFSLFPIRFCFFGSFVFQFFFFFLFFFLFLLLLLLLLLLFFFWRLKPFCRTE